MKRFCRLALLILLVAPLHAPADEEHTPQLVQSEPGTNSWNTGSAPLDWRGEITRYHGHIGPWNVLGWRIGQAAMRELNAVWGKHELDILCYVPPSTPFSCIMDGLAVSTGNSQGRLDLRMAEVMCYQQSFVSVRRKDGRGGVIEFRPVAAYLKSIVGQTAEKLETLCRECETAPEGSLFKVIRVGT